MYEQQHDEALLAAVEIEGHVEQTVEEDPEEDPEEEPMDDGIGFTDRFGHPARVVRDPTPSPPPHISSEEEESEDFAPVDYEAEDVPSSDPDSPSSASDSSAETETSSEPDAPLPPPVLGISVARYEFIVASMTARLAEAEARLDESRRQLAAEREARLAPRGWMRLTTPSAVRRVMTRIECRARVQVRSLPEDLAGRVSRVRAERILRRAMRRVRDLTRFRG